MYHMRFPRRPLCHVFGDVFFSPERGGCGVTAGECRVNLLTQPPAFRSLRASVWKGKNRTVRTESEIKTKRRHTFKTDESFLMDIITVVWKWELYCVFWLIRPQWGVRYRRHVCISQYTQKTHSHYTPGHTFNMWSTKIPQVWTTSITMWPPYQVTRMSFYRRAMLNHLPLRSQL